MADKTQVYKIKTIGKDDSHRKYKDKLVGAKVRINTDKDFHFTGGWFAGDLIFEENTHVPHMNKSKSVSFYRVQLQKIDE